MELVEDHQAEVRQLRVVLQPAGENTFGDDLNPGGGTDPTFIAGDVTDGFAHPLTQQIGHTSGCGPGGQPSGLQHHDSAIIQPRFVQQPQWHDGGLAGSGRGDQQGGSWVGQGRPQRIHHFLDRQAVGRISRRVVHRPRLRAVSEARNLPIARGDTGLKKVQTRPAGGKCRSSL